MQHCGGRRPSTCNGGRRRSARWRPGETSCDAVHKPSGHDKARVRGARPRLLQIAADTRRRRRAPLCAAFLTITLASTSLLKCGIFLLPHTCQVAWDVIWNGDRATALAGVSGGRNFPVAAALVSAAFHDAGTYNA